MTNSWRFSHLALRQRPRFPGAYGASIVLETTPSKPSLPACFEDELAIACLVAIELKARLVCEQRFQKRLALDELKARDVPTVEMQEIEGVIDEPHLALAVGGRLGMGESLATQPRQRRRVRRRDKRS